MFVESRSCLKSLAWSFLVVDNTHRLMEAALHELYGGPKIRVAAYYDGAFEKLVEGILQEV